MPVVILIAGAVGAFVAARWIAREAKRVNGELRARQSPDGEPVPLRRRKDGTFGPG